MAILKDMTVVPDDYIVKHIKTNIATSQYRDGTVVYAVEKEYVPLVRCKDCKYWVPDQVGVVEQPYCTRLGYEKLTGLDLRIGSAEHFCCFGERRDE